MIDRLGLRHFLLFCVVIFGAVVLPNLLKSAVGCFNTYDFGIFIEAIQKMRWNSLNPEVLSYGYHIFNDHFDPILGIAAILSRVTGAAPALILIDALCVLISILPFYTLQKRNTLSGQQALFLSFYQIFNIAVAVATRSPGHPTLWAMAPLSFLFYGLIEKRFFMSLISLLILMACKEEFPFVGMALGFYLLFINDSVFGSKRKAMIIFMLSLMWGIFALILRPRLFAGAFYNHEGNFFKQLIFDPQSILNNYSPSILIFILMSFLPLFVYLGITIKNKIFWLPIIISLPMFALRILSGKFGYWYTAPLIVPLTFSLATEKRSMAKPIFYSLLLGTALIPFYDFSKELGKILLGGSPQSCPITKARYEQVQQLRKYDFRHQCGKLFATGGAGFVLTQEKIDFTAVKTEALSLAADECLVIDIAGGDPYPVSTHAVEGWAGQYQSVFSNVSFSILKAKNN